MLLTLPLLFPNTTLLLCNLGGSKIAEIQQISTYSRCCWGWWGCPFEFSSWQFLRREDTDHAHGGWLFSPARAKVHQPYPVYISPFLYIPIPVYPPSYISPCPMYYSPFLCITPQSYMLFKSFFILPCPIYDSSFFILPPILCTKQPPSHMYHLVIVFTMLTCYSSDDWVCQLIWLPKTPRY